MSLDQANRDTVSAPAAGTPLPARPLNIPEGFSIDSANPPLPNAVEVTVWLDKFDLPMPKGAGAWVQQTYDATSDGKRLGTILAIDSNYAAWKEQSKTDEYRTQWLHRNGFNSFPQMAQAIGAAIANPAKPLDVDQEVKDLLPKLPNGLGAIKCDIDHIVEKQMGGTSQPSNLQLLTGTVNQASGLQAFLKLKELARTFVTHSPDWKNVQRLSMRIGKAKVDPTPDDASVKLERLLRFNPQLGSAKVAATEDRKPLHLTAGVGETIYVKDKGESGVDEAGIRIVPGVKLATYRRTDGPKGSHDKASGLLDHRAMVMSETKAQGIDFQAHLPAAKPAPVAAPAAAGTAAEPLAPGVPAIPVGVEHRELKLDKDKFKSLTFHYPYLSPGTIKTVALDAKGGLTGTGTITPSVKFLGDLDFAFGPNELKLTRKLDVDALNNSAVMKKLSGSFRFTESSLDLDLLNFVPSGVLAFTMGPAAKPVLKGNVTAKVEGGAFVATGKVTAGEIPGISAGEGVITYHSKTGWEGWVKATTSSLPGVTKADVTVGVRGGLDGKPDFYGSGALTTRVRESELKLEASWKGTDVGYHGSVTVPKPLPMVDVVRLEGGYVGGVLTLTGEVKDFTWRNRFAGTLKVTYTQKDGGEGRFSGTVDAKTIGDTAKMDGHILLTLHENGAVSGQGEVSYQITKDIRPKLGVQLLAGPPQRVRLFGEFTVATIPLTGQWPKPGGEKREIIKGLGIKVPIPTPVPTLTAYFSATGSFGVTYGIGPLALTGVKFNGELFPLEDDPKIKASLTGRLSAPGFAGIYGTFGARLGAEVLAGAAGLNGGIDVTPSLRLNIDAGTTVNAEYSADKGFGFEAEASVKAALVAQIAFDLKASIYGAYGALEYSWTHPLNDPKPKQLGPEFKVTLGKIAYSKETGIVWPSLDQIDYSPKDFDPKSILIDLISETKPQKT